MEQAWLDIFVAEVTLYPANRKGWRNFITVYEDQAGTIKLGEFNQRDEGYDPEGTVVNINNQGDDVNPAILQTQIGLNKNAQVDFVVRLLDDQGVQTDFPISETATRAVSYQQMAAGISNRIGAAVETKVNINLVEDAAQLQTNVEVTANTDEGIVAVGLIQLNVVPGDPTPIGPG